MSTGFDERLSFGRIGENDISRWLRRRGNCVIPVYEKETPEGQEQKKGPQLFTPDAEIVLPDMIVVSDFNVMFIEAKHKTVFTWFRKNRTWQTGIDRRHFNEYKKASEIVGWTVWLMFLHCCSMPSEIDLRYDECPRECPTGLYAESLEKLVKCIDHTSDLYGRSGMVYWNIESLQRLASLEEVRKS